MSVASESARKIHKSRRCQSYHPIRRILFQHMKIGQFPPCTYVGQEVNQSLALHFVR